jgi:hypothetical protein
MRIKAVTAGDLDYRVFALAHVPLDSDEKKALGLANVVRETLQIYNILGKATYAVTDTTAVMTATVTHFRLKWVPCFAHLFNLMLGSIIQRVKPVN